MKEESHVLLADDEETFLYSTADLLKKEGFKCDCVRDSEEAIASVKANDYDVLVVDINMPGNTKLEFIRELQENYPAIPVILVTGYPSLPTAIDSVKLAVVDYLVKPLDISELLGKIKASVEQANARKSLHKAKTAIDGYLTKMKRVTRAMHPPPSTEAVSGLNLTMDYYVDMTLFHISEVAMMLKNTLDTMRHGNPSDSLDVCKYLDCSRRTAFEEGIQQTIEVLKKTKGSFKSKELGLLRVKLEKLLGG